MANDKLEGLEWLEAAMGAVSKIAPDADPELVGARCPKCEASDFIRVSDLYSEAIGRLQENPDAATSHRVGGLSDQQIVAKFRPPRQRSLLGMGVLVAVPLGAIAYYLYGRFGESTGQLAIMVAIIVTAVVLLTSARRFSDQYYHRRRRWNSLFMCRRCGQLVAS